MEHKNLVKEDDGTVRYVACFSGGKDSVTTVILP